MESRRSAHRPRVVTTVSAAESSGLPPLSRADASVATALDVVRPLRRRARWIVLAVLVAVVALGATAVVAVRAMAKDGHRTAAEDVVRDYLEAIAAGDVDRALGMAGTDVAADANVDNRFLTADAVADDWSVGEVEYRVDDNEGDEPRWATVEAEVVVAGESHTAAFELARDGLDSPWRIQNPTVDLQVMPVPLLYFEANGVASDPGTSVLPRYRFLPGAYHLYSGLSELIDGAEEPVVLLPPSWWDMNKGVLIPHLSISDKGLAVVQDAVDAKIDDCVGRASQLVPGCPFGALELSSQVDGRVMDRIDSLSWRVDSYPEVAVDETIQEFPLAASSSGTITLTASGADAVGTPLDVEMTCSISLDELSVGWDADGSVPLYQSGKRYDYEGFDDDILMWNTC